MLMALRTAHLASQAPKGRTNFSQGNALGNAVQISPSPERASQSQAAIAGCIGAPFQGLESFCDANLGRCTIRRKARRRSAGQHLDERAIRKAFGHYGIFFVHCSLPFAQKCHGLNARSKVAKGGAPVVRQLGIDEGACGWQVYPL
jgi:hypothetical protein